jgi:hypothetical protein
VNAAVNVQTVTCKQLRFAMALTRTGGGGVAWQVTEGDGWWQRAETAWCMASRLGGRRALAKWAGQEMRAGRLGDKRGRWAVDDLVDVRRPGGGRGRRLEVLVKWAGEWTDSWRGIRMLTEDMRKRARMMEARKYAKRARADEGEHEETGRATRARVARGFGGGLVGGLGGTARDSRP